MKVGPAPQCPGEGDDDGEGDGVGVGDPPPPPGENVPTVSVTVVPSATELPAAGSCARTTPSCFSFDTALSTTLTK